MITLPVLMLPDYEKPFTLITDASDYMTGAILEQRDAVERTHPIAEEPEVYKRTDGPLEPAL
jgi:hypothetical protein